MSAPSSRRIALVLPIQSSYAARAATQIVIFLLRTSRRAVLALPSDDTFAPPSAGAPQRFGLLFVAANVQVPQDDAAARVRLERIIRAVARRQYSRYGIPDVSYDLQVL